jgi:hypothetical protein
MTNRITASGMVVAVVFSLAAGADAAIYRVSAGVTDVLAGTTTNLSVEVETEAGDNVVGLGYFSFAVDLALSGTAGATANDISNVLINNTAFDDFSSSNMGFPNDADYLGIAGATTNFSPPTFGYNVGDLTWLFDFDLAVPVAAEVGDKITITPREGVNQNVVAGSFANVAPQNFQPVTLTVVPEPTTAVLLGILAGAVLRRRRR